MSAQELVNRYQVWIDQNRDVFDWINMKTTAGNAFASSLLAALGRYGSLTPNQEAAVRRSIANEAARATMAANPTAIIQGGGYTKLLEAFQKARTSGLKWPKVHIGSLTFKLAGENSKNPGSLYIKAGETYLGKVSPQGEFRRSFDCSATDEEIIVSVGRDPLAEAVSHGKRTGHCAICSRKLTDPESVDRGIGPVCATKFGW